jgi:3-oxoadipate enol-lactonase
VPNITRDANAYGEPALICELYHYLSIQQRVQLTREVNDMQFATLNDVTLHYQIISASSKKPVLVFANSLGTDFRIWRDVIIRLAGDFEIVCYDKRGHGLSDIGATPYTLADHARDLAALLDHLQIDKAVICGVSVGGMIAQQLFAMRPELVRALILFDTAHKIGSTELWNARIAAVQDEGLESIAESILARWFSVGFKANRKTDLAGYRNMLVRTPRDGYAATCAAIRDADLTDVAAAITVPTLCVVGDQDGSTPPQLVAEFAKLVPGARYEVISGAGHLPCVEQPALVETSMRQFLAELPPQK